MLHAQLKNYEHAKTHQRADVFNTDYKDVAVFPEFSHTFTLRNLPFHRIQSGAASMIRQSGNIFDIAQAICTRSNRVLGFFHPYRVHLLMMGSCRTANSCKAGLIVGAPRVACNGLCTAARLHSTDENPGMRPRIGVLTALHSMSYFVPLPCRSLAWHRRVHFSHGQLSKLEFVVKNCASSCAVFLHAVVNEFTDEELIIVCEIVFNDSKHAAGVTLGIAHARRSMALLRTCNELFMRSKHLFHFSSLSRFQSCWKCLQRVQLLSG